MFHVASPPLERKHRGSKTPGEKRAMALPKRTPDRTKRVRRGAATLVNGISPLRSESPLSFSVTTNKRVRKHASLTLLSFSVAREGDDTLCKEAVLWLESDTSPRDFLPRFAGSLGEREPEDGAVAAVPMSRNADSRFSTVPCSTSVDSGAGPDEERDVELSRSAETRCSTVPSSMADGAGKCSCLGLSRIGPASFDKYAAAGEVGMMVA